MSGVSSAAGSLAATPQSPAVSVVIPAYKHADYIANALASVFAQTFQDFEVIVINDGSPDHTGDTLLPWVTTGRIRYLEQKNAGQSAARNAGTALARGEFLAFLDDDDLWPENKLELQIAQLRKNPEAVVSYGYVEGFGGTQNFRDPRSPGPSGWIKSTLLRGNVITSPGQTVIRVEHLRAVGGLDRSISGAEDWDLWLRLADRGTFEFLEECTLKYRLHANNASNNANYMFSAQMQVLKKHLGATPFSNRWKEWFYCRRNVGRWSAAPEIAKAREARASRKPLTALRHLVRAVRFDPPFLGSPRLWRILAHR